jgi:hypothetical protein
MKNYLKNPLSGNLELASIDGATKLDTPNGISIAPSVYGNITLNLGEESGDPYVLLLGTGINSLPSISTDFVMPYGFMGQLFQLRGSTSGSYQCSISTVSIMSAYNYYNAQIETHVANQFSDFKVGWYNYNNKWYPGIKKALGSTRTVALNGYFVGEASDKSFLVVRASDLTNYTAETGVIAPSIQLLRGTYVFPDSFTTSMLTNQIENSTLLNYVDLQSNLQYTINFTNNQNWSNILLSPNYYILNGYMRSKGELFLECFQYGANTTSMHCYHAWINQPIPTGQRSFSGWKTVY